MDANIEGLIARNALFVVNHSAGKDSQAMQIFLKGFVPPEQTLVIHADLGDVEWDDCAGHIRRSIGNLPLIVCKNDNKTFLEMVAHRGMFPSPSNRQCTSDLKRNPIEREVRRYLKANEQYGGLVVNCMGLRAEESPNRAKAEAFKFSARNSLAGREWYDWLPIHDMKEAEVFRTIREDGQEPHPVYAQGMKRKSCKLCIMSSDADLKRAAELDPVNFYRYVAMERSTGRTMMMPRGGVARNLEEITGLDAVALLERNGYDVAEVEASFTASTGVILSVPSPSQMAA
jgi:3'-phosphoadenosine 5'-phosphosulfate sulfotransferase (PAPS reductase)/FAD synthetase